MAHWGNSAELLEELAGLCEIKQNGGPAHSRPTDPSPTLRSSKSLDPPNLLDLKGTKGKEEYRMRGRQTRRCIWTRRCTRMNQGRGKLAKSASNSNYLMMIVNERIVCWNCRGAKSREFACKIRELIRRYQPKIIILLDPKISREAADQVCKKLGMRSWIRSEAAGFNGGVWFCEMMKT